MYSIPRCYRCFMLQNIQDPSCYYFSASGSSKKGFGSFDFGDLAPFHLELYIGYEGWVHPLLPRYQRIASTAESAPWCAAQQEQLKELQDRLCHKSHVTRQPTSSLNPYPSLPAVASIGMGNTAWAYIMDLGEREREREVRGLQLKGMSTSATSRYR